jgi:CheY-like chemotaxis protein
MNKDGGDLRIEVGKTHLPDPTLSSQELPSGSYIRLHICDSGQGIDPKIQNKIFEPYFTTKETGKGTGMGLAIVHGIVKHHGGSIVVDSQPGKGSCFEILLPEAKETLAPDKADTNPIPCGQAHLLFVDDEPSLCEVGQEMLEFLGYSVKTCTDPLEALSLFKAKPEAFQLVISDKTMPDMSGDQLIREILSICPKVCTLIATGVNTPDPHEATSLPGTTRVLLKPWDMKTLAQAVREALAEKTPV